MVARHVLRRINALTVALGFVLLLCLMALSFGRASAYAQMTERSIAIGTSEVSATNVIYTVTFKPATTGPIQTIIIDFCDNPLIGTVCTAPTGLNSNETTLTVANESGTGFGTAWAVDQTESTANTVVIKDAAGGSVTAGNAVSFDLGTGSGGDGLTNPSGNGSFYARIITFATNTAGDSYDSSATGSNNPPAAAIDAGGVALSTANQITVNARVQEVLQFCVGTDDSGAADDCGDISGTTVDLGVVSSDGVSISPVLVSEGGNNRNGLAMVRTNAVNGVVIDYFAEPVTGDTGSTHLGALRVEDSTCTGTGLLGGSQVDQCFNSAGTTRVEFAANQEGFGMTVSSVDTSNGTTTNLQRDADYAGDGTNAAAGSGGGWAWSQTVTDRIASSAGSSVKVVDDEMLILRFAAQAAVTTPTGQYGVTSTYIATATY